MQLAAADSRRNILHFHCLFEGKMSLAHWNGDNNIQYFCLGRYFVTKYVRKPHFTDDASNTIKFAIVYLLK